jgi:hypothetical protein
LNRSHKILDPVIVLARAALKRCGSSWRLAACGPAGWATSRILVWPFYKTRLVSGAGKFCALRFAVAETARAFDYHRTLEGVYARRIIPQSPAPRPREGLVNIVFRPGRWSIDDASAPRSGAVGDFFSQKSCDPGGRCARPGRENRPPRAIAQVVLS